MPWLLFGYALSYLLELSVLAVETLPIGRRYALHLCTRVYACMQLCAACVWFVMHLGLS